MSSALAMILAAGMAIGDGPEKVSGEMIRESQPLDLRGDWEGTWWSYQDPLQASSREGRLVGVGTVLRGIRYRTSIAIRDIIDEGHGKLRGEWDLTGGKKIHGIYRQDGAQLIICFSKAPHPRPTSFRVGSDQHLLILRRVKPRK